MKRENAGSWNSGLKRIKFEMPILRNSKTVKINVDFFGIYKKYWVEEVPEGRQQRATSLLGAATPLAAPRGLVGSQLALWLPPFATRRVSIWKKTGGGFSEDPSPPRGGT